MRSPPVTRRPHSRAVHLQLVGTSRCEAQATMASAVVGPLPGMPRSRFPREVPPTGYCVCPRGRRRGGHGPVRSGGVQANAQGRSPRQRIWPRAAAGREALGGVSLHDHVDEASEVRLRRDSAPTNSPPRSTPITGDSGPTRTPRHRTPHLSLVRHASRAPSGWKDIAWAERNPRPGRWRLSAPRRACRGRRGIVRVLHPQRDAQVVSSDVVVDRARRPLCRGDHGHRACPAWPR